MYQLDTPAKEDSSSGRESGDAVGADHEGRGSGDEEERTDWGVRRVDGDGDSDRRKGSFCFGSEREKEGKGAEEISDGNVRSNDSRKGKGHKRKRSNPGAENVSSESVTARKSESTCGRVRTPNVRNQ